MAKSIVAPWAADKLDRLEKYLSAYTTIMRKQPWCRGYYYIDAFAGPGEHQVRARRSKSKEKENLLLAIADFGRADEQQQQFLAGSPRVALEIKYPFTGYVFVERSPSRIAALKSLKSKYGATRQIKIRQRECNEYLREHVISSPPR